MAGGAGRAGQQGFFYVDDDPRGIGRALRWAQSQKLDRVEVLTGDGPGAGHLARRAHLMSGPPAGTPEVTVWAVTGAEASPVEPTPIPPAPAIPPSHWPLAGVMTEAGAHPVDDHGVLVAEVAGLEVARVVDTPDGPVLDIGVGQADRDLHQLVHRQLDPDTGLRHVIAAVAELRSSQSHHPLTRVARERWLRAWLIEDPSPVGAAELTPLPPLRPRQGLKVPEPAASHGTTPDGRPLVVVTMVGVDLDLLPEAADHRQRTNPDAELVLACPGRDLTLNSTFLDRVRGARAVAVEGPWAP